MIPNYTNLSLAKYELTQYLNCVSEHHPTRSIVERVIHDIDKVIKSNPITKACTPESEYVDQKFKEIGGY